MRVGRPERELGGAQAGAVAAGPLAADEVRPTSDRARETLFSILGDVSDLSVLDLFCGTGALAIEAISRGADSAVLVDRAPALAQAQRRGARDRQPLRARALGRDPLPGAHRRALRARVLRSAV